jgi:hypothetical protein
VKSLRQNLRQLAIAWLVIQALSLSALAGFDCCATHRAVRQEATAAAAEGVPCPMHAASANTAPANAERCVMRGTCKGPIAALFVLLANNGVPAESPVAAADVGVSPAPVLLPETFAVHFESPDTPPPRV